MKPLLLLLVLAKSLQADGNTAGDTLAKASRLGDVKTLESLLSAGISADLQDRYGRAPIYYAASFKQVKAVELLLAYHADPNPPITSRSFEPSTPLQWAAELGNRQLASILIAAGARVNETGPMGRSALHCANDQLGVIRLLIEKGADVNARDREGESALDEAAWHGSFDTVALLLAHGARINESETKTGATPINEAAYKGHARLVEYLLQFKPDLEIPDKHGYRPLDNAIRMGKEDCALLLLAAAGDQQTPEFFQKAMDMAIRKAEPVVVESLIKHGANVNGTLPSGATPLDVAAFNGAAKVVDVLLKNHADPNMSGRNGIRPLEDAALKGFDGIAGMLLDHGAEVNHVSDGSGTTALYSAASFGKGEVVALLLKRGADANVCGKNQKSAYQAALENGFGEVAAQIKEHGGGKNCGR